MKKITLTLLVLISLIGSNRLFAQGDASRSASDNTPIITTTVIEEDAEETKNSWVTLGLAGFGIVLVSYFYSKRSAKRKAARKKLEENNDQA